MNSCRSASLKPAGCVAELKIAFLNAARFSSCRVLSAILVASNTVSTNSSLSANCSGEMPARSRNSSTTSEVTSIHRCCRCASGVWIVSDSNSDKAAPANGTAPVAARAAARATSPLLVLAGTSIRFEPARSRVSLISRVYLPSALTASSTSSACPGTLTLSQRWATLPFSSMR